MPTAEIPSDDPNNSPDSSLSSASSASNHPYQPQIRLHRILSNNSFDYEVSAEDDNYPAQAYLLPVVLPPVSEPTLDELLRRVTGRNDLQNVEDVKLRVISSMVSLSRLSLFMPKLVSLNLDGSVLSSLRDLGCGLTCLTRLNVSNCGLSSLDGTGGFPMIEVLIADGNMIQIVGALSNLPLLKRLSLKDNRIRQLGMLTFLGLCPNLIEVDLQGNPVTNFILYRPTIQRNVRSLELLDGEPFGENLRQDASQTDSNSDKSLSTLSDEPFSDFSEHGREQRPSTSAGVSCHVVVQRAERPFTASAAETRTQRPLYSTSSVVGSIVEIARQRKLSKKATTTTKSAWEGSSSSSSSSMSSLDNSRSFPNQLPQLNIPLELGVLRSEARQRSSDSDESWKEMAQKWRRDFRNRKGDGN